MIAGHSNLTKTADELSHHLSKIDLDSHTKPFQRITIGQSYLLKNKDSVVTLLDDVLKLYVSTLSSISCRASKLSIFVIGDSQGMWSYIVGAFMIDSCTERVERLIEQYVSQKFHEEGIQIRHRSADGFSHFNLMHSVGDNARPTFITEVYQIEINMK